MLFFKAIFTMCSPRGSDQIQEEGLCHIKLSPKGIGGLACKGLLKIMLENVTNVKDMF